jgi:hypothetical protein
MNSYVCPHCKRVWYTETKVIVVPRHTEYGGDFIPTTPPDTKECVTSGCTMIFDKNKYGAWSIQALFVFGVVCLCRLTHFIEQFLRAMP